MTSVTSYPLLDKVKCPYCGYEPFNLSYIPNEQGFHTHNCWKCKREYRIIGFVSTSYLCIPISDDESEDGDD